MPRDYIATIGTETVELPAEVTPGKIRITWVNEAGAMVCQRDIDGLEELFESIDAGNYTVSAVRLDTAGQPIGQPVTVQHTVTPSTYEAPVSISIQVKA